MVQDWGFRDPGSAQPGVQCCLTPSLSGSGSTDAHRAHGVARSGRSSAAGLECRELGVADDSGRARTGVRELAKPQRLGQSGRAFDAPDFAEPRGVDDQLREELSERVAERGVAPDAPTEQRLSVALKILAGDR